MHYNSALLRYLEYLLRHTAVFIASYPRILLRSIAILFLLYNGDHNIQVQRKPMNKIRKPTQMTKYANQHKWRSTQTYTQW